MPFKPVGHALLTLLGPPTEEALISAETELMGKPEAGGVFASLFGILKADHKATLEEMDAGIWQHAMWEYYDRT